MSFFSLKLFNTPKHKVFNYQPVYYDERKEALEEKIAAAERRNKGQYVPGESIKGAFTKPRFEVKRSSSMVDKVIRILTIVTLAILMLAVLYFTNVIDLFFK